MSSTSVRKLRDSAREGWLSGIVSVDSTWSLTDLAWSAKRCSVKKA